MNIEIRPVHTKADRHAFLTFPWQIYRDDPLWVPPLIPEQIKIVDPQRGPFFKRGEAEFFIARRDGQIVGTICAGQDRVLNQATNRQDGLLGFFECVQDYDVAAALLECAARWATSRGLGAIEGPFHLDREAGYGLLIQGRDRPPVLLCGHTPPYYVDFFERFGFGPARADNLAYAIDIRADTAAFQRLARLADRLRKRKSITVRGVDMAHWRDEAECIFQVINRALAHLNDFAPWDHEEFVALLEPFRKIADPELILIAEADGQVVGWFPGVPNLNEAFQHANGLRYPWDYARLWWQLRRQPQCLAVKSVLVLPEYWDRGAAVLLFDEMLRRAREKGYAWVDLSLTSDDNPYAPTLATRLGAELYKRYRVYRLNL
ncbi:MAG: GNAT family N-acetyltransferase [Anaerolineae bacterium]|nr:GNAT family N-acetyltransferase [Anaerolineae bacterium]